MQVEPPPIVVIEREVLCIGCGYQLRGLMPMGKCPECGVDIEQSLRGDVLSAAEPNWLRRVARGQKMAMIAAILIASGAVTLLISFGALMVFGVSMAMGSTRSAMGVVMVALGFLSLAAAAAIAAGILLGVAAALVITVPEPRAALTESQWSYRQRTKLGTLAAFVLPSFAALASLILPRGSLEQRAMLLIAGLLFVSISAWASSNLMRYLRELVARADGEPTHLSAINKKLRRDARLVAWAVPLLAAIWVVPGLFTPAGGLPMGILSCALLLLAAVLMLRSTTIARTMRACDRLFSNALRRT